MRIGLYGGTFDPVHVGHLILARDARERLELATVWFIPCAQSPHKALQPDAGAVHRVAMLRLAVAGEDGFAVDEYEVDKSAPSYAVDTAEHFARRFPGAELYWLLGDDQRARLDEWHRREDLTRLVTFDFLARSGGTERGAGRSVDVSASEVRGRRAAGKSVRYLVPDAVLAYMEEHGLYE